MCLCLTNPKLCSLEQAVVLNICKIEIFYDLKEFFKFYLFSITVKAEIGFIFIK